jgi:hypothetical protein
MRRMLLALPLCLAVVAPAPAQSAKDVVRKVEAVFEPAEAKPGQTVTLKITVQLADGYYTYPTAQPAPEAKYSTNAIVFPAGGPVVFVDQTVNPASPKTNCSPTPAAGPGPARRSSLRPPRPVRPRPG